MTDFINEIRKEKLKLALFLFMHPDDIGNKNDLMKVIRENENI